MWKSLMPNHLILILDEIVGILNNVVLDLQQISRQQEQLSNFQEDDSIVICICIVNLNFRKMSKTTLFQVSE